MHYFIKPLCSLLFVSLLLQPVFSQNISSLPWLSVRAVDKTANPLSHRDYVIVDEFSRELTLRGACLESEERDTAPFDRPIDPNVYANGSCPENLIGNDGSYEEPPICGVDAGKGRFQANDTDIGLNDFASARSLGLNIMRLCLSWSELEPLPGFYDPIYLDRVAQLVSWAKEQGVYVILDLHQDLYSLFIQPLPNETSYPPFLTPGGGQDGAPLWAIKTDGFPPLNIFGVGDLNLAILRAFDNLYNNSVIPGIPQGDAPGPGLGDHYIGAVARLAARFINESTVAGIELINEPLPGWEYLIDPAKQAQEFLFPFYKRIIQAITGVRDGLPDCPKGVAVPISEQCAYPSLGIEDRRHIVFFEPSALRNTFDATFDNASTPFTSYGNIVFTPHVYTHVFTIDAELKFLNITDYPPSFAYAYETAWAEANALHAAVLVTEFGAGHDSDATLVLPTLDEAERHQTGGTLWSWKSNCGDGENCAWSWTLFAPAVGNGTGPPNGPIYASRELMMSRIHSRGAPGEVLISLFNVTTRSFVLTANVTTDTWSKLKGKDTKDINSMKPFSLFLSKDTFDASLPMRLSANGTNAEIYLPKIEMMDPIAVTNCELVGTVTWPDNSRTAYFKPLGPGVYTIGVPPSNSTITGDETVLSWLNNESERVLNSRPTAQKLIENSKNNLQSATNAKQVYDVFVTEAVEKVKDILVKLPPL
jgi:hypothetical protein